MEYLQKILIFLLLDVMWITFADAQSGSQCYNRQRQSGTCVPLSLCSKFNRYQRPDRNDICGFSGWDPQVCCVTSDNGPSSIGTNSPKQGLLPTPGSGDCGLDTSDKIFGGSETKLDEYPWLALLQYRKNDGRLRFQCGGVLISSRYVLTAGHCLPAGYTLTLVRLGESDLDTDPDCVLQECADPVQDIPVAEIIRHPDYNLNGNEHNDIALLRLARPAKVSYFVKPICLPSVAALRGSTRDAGQSFVVAGWGRTETRGQSNKKLKVEVGGVEQTVCKEKYQKLAKRVVIPSQLCAGGEAGKDSCQGDSGGPLMGQFNDGRGANYYYLAGLVSYGPKDCGTPGLPGVYTRVASFIEWIEANIKQ